MNRIVEYLQHIEEHYSKGQELIDWDDLFEFERSYKLNYKLGQIKNRLSYLHKWELAIGQSVYLSKDKWNYTLVSGYHLLDALNQREFDNTKSDTFTKEYFDRLCLDYIDYSIAYLENFLFERELTSNSTSKIKNLAFEWELECKQELIKEFKNALKY
jgi:hypothetical protein